MTVLLVSGTGTGVGKTVVTAALAAIARAGGLRVAVVKPAQTGAAPAGPPPAEAATTGPAPAGTSGDIPDIDTVRRLSGVTDTHELARYPDPLSPEAAARLSGLPPLDMAAAATYIKQLASERDLVLVEGAGGLLVRYDPAGTTIADLAGMLDAPVLVVTAAGLGTLNLTALTCEALERRGLTRHGVVIGSWPAEPGLAEHANLDDLTAVTGRPLAGRLPQGAGALGRDAFLEVARAELGRVIG
jgi:dethiobiotin synthetase